MSEPLPRVRQELDSTLVERALAGMNAQGRAVLEQPRRESWAPVVGINLYDVAEQDWQRHLDLVRQLGPSPLAWVERGARVHLLAAWRGAGVRHVVWINWFPAANLFLGADATPQEQAQLAEWLAMIGDRTWHVAEDFTHLVAADALPSE